MCVVSLPPSPPPNFSPSVCPPSTEKPIRTNKQIYTDHPNPINRRQQVAKAAIKLVPSRPALLKPSIQPSPPSFHWCDLLLLPQRVHACVRAPQPQLSHLARRLAAAARDVGQPLRFDGQRRQHGRLPHRQLPELAEVDEPVVVDVGLPERLVDERGAVDDSPSAAVALQGGLHELRQLLPRDLPIPVDVIDAEGQLDLLVE
mmetsp:Transcript_30782/g.89532  ORF Transcript_30782/g.89532 Transcript_30782/m.89532 type:complete len:202 (-) Transcript_30782:160-765(-)